MHAQISDLNKPFGSLTQVQLTVTMSCGGSPLQYSVLPGGKGDHGERGSVSFVSLLMDINV